MAADVMAGIRLISKADTSGIEKMSAAVANFNNTAVSAQMSVAPLQNIGKTFMGVGLAIEAGLGVAVVAAVNYEYLIQRIATESRLAGDQIATLHDRFLILSTSTGVAAEELAKLGFSASKLGLDAAGIETFVKVGAELNLISGGAITAEEAISRIGRIGKVFHIDLAANAEKIASTFVGLARITTATESEIAAVVSRTAELGRSVGFTVPQLAALAATAKDLGLDGRRASGAIEDLIGAMSKKDSARLFARQLQMTGEEFRNALGKNPVAILNKLQGAFQGLDPRIFEDRLKHMGITSNATQTLVKGLADEHSALSRNLKVAQEEFEKGTAAAEAYEELIGTTKMQLQILWQTVKSIAIAFGEILLPPLKLVVMVTNFFLKLVLAIPKPFKAIIVVAAALVGGLFLLTGTVIVATVAFRRFNLALGGTIQGLLGGASAAGFRLSSILQLLAIRATAVGGSFLGTGSILGTVLGPLLAWGRGVIFASAGTFMFTGSLLAAGKVMIAMIGTALLPFIKVVAIVAVVAAAVYVAWVALKPMLMEVWGAFKLLYEPVRVLVEGVRELTGAFGITGGGIGETFITFVRIGMLPIIINLKALAFGFRLLASILTGVARGVIAVLKPILEPLVKLWNFVKGIISPILDLFAAITSGGNEAAGIFEGIASAAEFAFKWLTPIGLMFQAIGAIFQGVGFEIENVWAGIMDAFEPVYEQLYGSALLIQEAWGDVTQAFDDLLFPFRIFLSELGILDGVGDSIFKKIGFAIRWVVSTALLPMVYAIRFVIGLVTGLARIWLYAGKVILNAIEFLAKPLKFIADLITGIVTGLTHLIRGTEAAAPAAVVAATDANDAAQGDQFAKGMNQALVRNADRYGEPALAVPTEKKLARHARFGLPPVRMQEAAALRPRFELGGGETEPVPHFMPPASRIAGALGASTAAVNKTVAAAAGGGAQLPSMNITIPVSVMMDGEELGKAIVTVNDDQIRRQFGKRVGRFSGVE